MLFARYALGQMLQGLFTKVAVVVVVYDVLHLKPSLLAPAPLIIELIVNLQPLPSMYPTKSSLLCIQQSLVPHIASAMIDCYMQSCTGSHVLLTPSH